MDLIEKYRSELDKYRRRSEKFIKNINWHSRSIQLHLGVLSLWIIYLIILLTTPIADSPLIHISRQALRLLQILIALMYLATWQMAIYAFNRLAGYSAAIKNSKESKGFRLLATSILILLLSLVAATFVSSINSHISGAGHRSSAFIILTNYLYVFPFLAAFWSFWNGSKFLVKRIKSKASLLTVTILSALLILFMYFWLNSIFTNQLRTSSPNPQIPATYYLKDTLIVLTIVLPAFLAWILSIATILNLNTYSRKVEGSIYRRALNVLSWGIWAVIIGSVFLQGLQSLGSIRLAKLGLVKLVILVFAFLTIQLLGYVFVALGAKRLNKIETV